MRRAHVIDAYRAQYENPIHFPKGEVVSIGHRDTQWPDWVWTTTRDGNSGWTPVEWLNPLDDGKAEALRDYSAKEANVDAGDIVGFCWEYGGWCWVIPDMQNFGWVPATNLELEPDVPTPEPTIEEIATDWIKYWAHGGPDNTEASEPYGGATVDLNFLVHDEPSKAWDTILEMVTRTEAEPHFGVLAAGPVEDLLSLHGADFIDRVEVEAKRSPQFATLLGGVWKFTMTDEVWTRVQAVWNPRGGDDISQAATNDD